MSAEISRQCQNTGLRLLSAVPGDFGFRITKSKYPATTAPARANGDRREDWNRYDAPGQTLYVAEKRECAYAELLSGFKRHLGASDSLLKDAIALDMSISEFVEELATEWSEKSFMGMGAIPAAWRNDRTIYQVLLPTQGWWVDIEHPDSIAAIEEKLEQQLAAEKINHLTTAVLRSDNRIVTTMIAQAVRDLELDDGTRSHGIHFGSKHGGAWCRAVWLGDEYQGLVATSGEPILLSDDDLKLVADRFRIKVF